MSNDRISRFACTDSPNPTKAQQSAEAHQDYLDWVAKHGPVELTPCGPRTGKVEQAFTISFNGRAKEKAKAGDDEL